jgi:hypothetical protein
MLLTKPAFLLIYGNVLQQAEPVSVYYSCGFSAGSPLAEKIFNKRENGLTFKEVRMNSKTRVLACMLAIVGVLMFGVAAFAQEHPEHPAKKDEAKKEHPEHPAKQDAAAKKEHPEHPAKQAAAAKKEHPEHPAKGTAAKAEHPEHPNAATAAVTKEMMAETITGYVEKDAALKGGYFCVYDAKANAPLALALDKVHQDKLAKVSDGLFFACCDFKATNGTMYDLDFFMKSTPMGLRVSEVAVHKEAGKPRYGWVEKDGVWSKQVMQ